MYKGLDIREMIGNMSEINRRKPKCFKLFIVQLMLLTIICGNFYSVSANVKNNLVAEENIGNINYALEESKKSSEHLSPPQEGIKMLIRKADNSEENLVTSDVETAFSNALSITSAEKDIQITLFDNIKLSKSLDVKGKTVILDLNGYTIDRNINGKMNSKAFVFHILEGASFKIIDSAPGCLNYSSSIRGGVITGGAGDDVGGCFCLEKNSKFDMQGGSIVGCVTNDHGGAVRLKNDNISVTLNNVGFYTNMTYDSADNSNGGAIYIDGDDSLVTCTNCIFEGNYSEDYGGAVFVNDGEFKAHNCLFVGNECKDDGGAVYVDSGAKAKIYNCIFTENFAQSHAGAIYCNSNENTYLTGIFKYNTSQKSGGAIYVCGKKVLLGDGTVVESNTASTSGAGVFVDQDYDVRMQGCIKVRNNHKSDGTNSNLHLAYNWFADAHIINCGIEPESEIWISTYKSSEHMVSNNISEVQEKCFKSDNTSKSFSNNNKTEKTNKIYLMSVVGNGRIIIIITGILVIFMVLIKMKHRKKET